MTLYDKIMELRKRNGLSQEELGEKIGVSRQAVSKWEMAQTTPDLNKIMALAELFGVSTDFLLKDEYDLSYLEKEIECNRSFGKKTSSETKEGISKNDPGNYKKDREGQIRFIDLEEVQLYIKTRRSAAKNFVIAVLLFFISPFSGLIMSLFNEKIVTVGIIIQIVILIIATVIIILTLWELSKYKYLKDGTNELAYGVYGIVEKYKEEFEHTHLIGIIIGAICIIGCVLPMIIVSAFTSYDDFAIAIGGCFMLLIFASGLSSIVYVVTINHGYKLLLRLCSILCGTQISV